MDSNHRQIAYQATTLPLSYSLFFLIYILQLHVPVQLLCYDLALITNITQVRIKYTNIYLYTCILLYASRLSERDGRYVQSSSTISP